ncbi:MAG TPA: hypothetical protein VD858_15525 [Reyranella sp.]|nr:hypothetical protein [Reyranella sp.]
MDVVVDLDGTLADCTHRLHHTRGRGHRRADVIVKRERLARMRADGFSPELAIDDRRRVVDMWRSEGLVCAQVAEGEF